MSTTLQKGGKHAEPKHMRLMLDSSEICIKCAESCEQFKGDENMAACARVCRRCADSCQ